MDLVVVLAVDLVVVLAVVGEDGDLMDTPGDKFWNFLRR
jgi:hypothetical protein